MLNTIQSFIYATLSVAAIGAFSAITVLSAGSFASYETEPHSNEQLAVSAVANAETVSHF